jgi:hypothetical protein
LRIPIGNWGGGGNSRQNWLQRVFFIIFKVGFPINEKNLVFFLLCIVLSGENLQ